MESGVEVNIDGKHYYCEYLLYSMSYREHHRFVAEFATESIIPHGKLCRKPVTFTVTDISGRNYRFGGVVISLSHLKRHGIPDKIRIEGGAPTLLMDMERGNDSFKDITIRGLVDKVLSGYATLLKYRLQGMESIVKMLDTVIDYRARYMETEWLFLMRLLKENDIPVWYSGEELIIGSAGRGGIDIELSMPEDLLYYEPVYMDTGFEWCIMGLHNPVLKIGDGLVVDGKDGLSPKLRVIAETITFCDRALEFAYEAIPSKRADRNLYRIDSACCPGFQIGTVIRNDDPESSGRVMVRLQWQRAVDESRTTNWIDVMRPDAGLYSGKQRNRGFFFIPEVGDEVVVSYFENDINRPVVCSPIYAAGASQWDDSGNCIKSFSTRSGHRIVFDDSDSGGIEIADRAGNTLKMESGSGSITLSSPQRITVSAKEIELSGGKVCEIASESLVKVKSGKDVSVASKDETEIVSDGGITLFAENELNMESNGEFGIEHNADGRWNGKGNVDIRSRIRVNIAKS